MYICVFIIIYGLCVHCNIIFTKELFDVLVRTGCVRFIRQEGPKARDLTSKPRGPTDSHHVSISRPREELAVGNC